jgi:hypothetical protein
MPDIKLLRVGGSNNALTKTLETNDVLLTLEIFKLILINSSVGVC